MWTENLQHLNLDDLILAKMKGQVKIKEKQVNKLSYYK